MTSTPVRFGERFCRLLLPIAFVVLPWPLAHASPITYTFSGSASGTISGSSIGTFSDASFTLTVDADTSDVVDQGGGYYRLNDVDGTFTEGAYTGTLTDVTIVTNGDAGFDNVDFYNASFNNGLGLQNNANLAGYMLTTAVNTGVATGSDLSPTYNSSGNGFATTAGAVVEFTGSQSLSFTATTPSAIPEPSSWLLLATGLSGVVAAARRKIRL